MFRINDNDDGSRVVYCSETGRRLCTIPKKRDKPLAEIQQHNTLSQVQQNNRKKPISKNKRRKAIGRPMPRAIDPHPSAAVVVNNHQYFQNGYRGLQCNIMPLPWIDNDLPTDAVVADRCEFDADKNLELDQDINEECISKEEFLQITELCAKPLAEDNSWKELRERLPTRSISRSLKRDAKIPDRFVSELPNKTYEDIDLSSPLALTWLKDMPDGQKRLLNDNSKSMYIKRCETFCKFAIGSPYVLGTAAPYSMRCRETKKYSVTFKPMKVATSCHKYCFTRKDRLERKIALRAGLNKRSRDLKKALSGNVFKVHLQRLGQEEIEKWTTRSRSSAIVPYIDLETEFPSCSASRGKERLKIKQNPSSSARKSVMATRNSIVSTRHTLKTPKMKTDIVLNMALKIGVKDVLEQLELKQGSMYVRGTTIKVRMPTQLSKYLSQNNMAPFANVVRYSQLGLQDHAYHRVAPQGLYPTVMKRSKGSSSQVKRPRVTSLKNGLSKKQKINSHASPSNVQVIDLCSEDDEKIVPTTPLPSSQSSKFTYVFRCFGCDSNNTYKTKTMATSAVKEHMVSYHAVAEPKAFLNIHINKASKILLIEAFPGYKEPNPV